MEKNKKINRKSAIKNDQTTTKESDLYIDDAIRVNIGDNYMNASSIRVFLGTPIIYLPILTLPFVFLSAWITFLHLWLLGAKNIRKYRDFIPDKRSHRYNYKSQPIMKKRNIFNIHVRSVIFWMFNCTRYCPYSVALFTWHTYLIKIVENFWCPFYHEKKTTYADAPIDKSYWHQLEEDKNKLHPDDRNNPIWNKDSIK